MVYKLQNTRQFEKKLDKLLDANPTLIDAYEKTLLLLSQNPHHPSLRLHKLSGKLKDYHSVSINLKYRITIDFVIEDDVIILIDITNHYS